MKFTLIMHCDNAAFGDSGEEITTEIARILQSVSKMVVDCPPATGGMLLGPLIDANGSIVGKYALDPSQ